MGFVSDEEKIKQSNSMAELESIITKAIKKVGGSKENDLCRYIPMSSGGYMHHFTLRKMKNKQPDSLANLIEKFIINNYRIILTFTYILTKKLDINFFN